MQCTIDFFIVKAHKFSLQFRAYYCLQYLYSIVVIVVIASEKAPKFSLCMHNSFVLYNTLQYCKCTIKINGIQYDYNDYNKFQ